MSVVIVTNSTLQCNQSYTATWTITNCLGTVLKVCSQTVTVTDTTPPVMYCTNLVLGCGDTSYTNPPVVIDRCCGTNVTVKLEFSELINNSCGQTISQTWLATDCCSNSIECIRRVNIVAGLGNALVVPTNNATVEGDVGNSYPFNIGASNMRYQQVYDASQFAAVPTDGAMITAISFRVDAGFPAFSGTLPGIQINLSTTFKAPGGLDPTFANNVGADDTIVFSGPLNLSSAASGSPAAFDIIIPLTTPFFYDPAALLGNLLLDVRNTGGGSISQFDATSTNNSVSRLYGGVGSATGVADSTGLVTDFTFGTGILTVICTNVTFPFCSPVPLVPPIVADACCTNWTVVTGGTQIIGLHPCHLSYWQFWHVFDCCSNHIACTTVIGMVDTNPPVFLNCVTNKTVPCSSAWSFDTPTAQYFCTGSNAVVGVISTVTNVGNGCSQTATRIWGATNECSGALATCTEVVTIIDTNPPVLVGCVASKQVQCGSVWTFDTPTAHYFCSGSNVAVGVVSTTTNVVTACSNVVTRVWDATNACDGLIATCSENIIITDTNPPSITCPTNIVVYTCVTNPVVVTWSTNVASDTCSSVTVTSSPPSGTAFQPNTTNIVTLTARDACGNTKSCTFLVELRRPVLDGLTVTYSPPNITLYWTDGILSQADSLSGPWTDTLGASPPSYTVSASAAARFYRLRCSSP